MNGTAKVQELVLLGGRSAARISCDSGLIPPPGRYVLAHEPTSAALLASALFLGGSCSGGFMAAPPIYPEWSPGSQLNLRGPLGHGFTLPAHARHVALVCIGSEPARLLPVAELALGQNAAVALVCDDPPDQLPLQLEIQPERSLRDVLAWCDYAAYDVEQSALADLMRRVRQLRGIAGNANSELLVHAPMPCGGLAECGMCSVRTPDGYRLACVDGPVFDGSLLLGRG